MSCHCTKKFVLDLNFLIIKKNRTNLNILLILYLPSHLFPFCPQCLHLIAIAALILQPHPYLSLLFTASEPQLSPLHFKPRQSLPPQQITWLEKNTWSSARTRFNRITVSLLEISSLSKGFCCVVFRVGIKTDVFQGFH